MLPLLQPIWMLLQNIHTTLVEKQCHRSFLSGTFVLGVVGSLVHGTV